MNVMATCEHCKKVGPKRSFFGRFCCRACIAKHAVLARQGLRRKNAIIKKNLQHVAKAARDSGSGVDVGSFNEAKSFTSSSRTGLKSSVPRSSNSRLMRTSSWKKRTFYEVMEESIRDVSLFDWNSYLSDQQAVGLEDKQFESITGRRAYPPTTNPFEQGCFLEAVDPLHQSLICLTSVAQVEGFRLRLHFVGYPDCYDFWVDADSPLLFPSGFCEKTGRKLNAPADSNMPGVCDIKNAFSESIYGNSTTFKIGNKVEAIDRKNHDLVCVATVKDIIGDYILVHFDGWDEDYDYWAESSSPFIHAIGWCAANEKQLTPPPHMDPGEPFEWNKYLKKCDAVAADSSCFRPKHHFFTQNTKIEVVDQRNPILIRVASIIDVTEARIRIHFDGWSETFDDWLDVDSRDIHPINWCYFANYPLHPPVNSNNIMKKSCPVGGCAALGHVNSSRQFKYHKKHYSEQGCPYSRRNLVKSDMIYNRFFTPGTGRVSIGGDHTTSKTEHYPRFMLKHKKRRAVSRLSSIENMDDKHSLSFRQHPKRYKIFHNKEVKRSGMHQCSGEYFRDATCLEPKPMSLNDRAIHSSILSSLATLSTKHLPHCWDKNVKNLPGVNGVRASHAMNWDIPRVGEFIRTITGKPEYGEAFEREEVDGEALLLLSQNDILNTLKLKLGPAVKIYNAVLLFKVMERNCES